MNKLYYDTNEVAEMLGCEPSSLRFWEKQFPHLKPKRDSRNRRRYTEADIEIIRKIIYQKEVQGRTLKGAQNQFNHRESAENLIKRLERVKGFLLEIKEGIS